MFNTQLALLKGKELKAANSVVAKVRDTFGEENIFRSSDSFGLEVASYTSGSVAFDDALGIWGLPQGRLIQYAGAESSGKTLLALVAAAYVTRVLRKFVYFIDAEHSLDPVWAAALGVDLSLMLISQPQHGGEVFDLLCGSPPPKSAQRTAKKAGKELARNKGLLEMPELEGQLGLIILDSIAALPAPQEFMVGAGDVLVAAQARFLPPVLRKLIPLLGKNGANMIAINQVRVNPGQLFGNPETTPGGRAFKHACSIMVNFAKVGAKDTEILDERKEPIGHIVSYNITKNKVAPPFKKGQLSIEYLRGVVNNETDLLELGKKYGLLKIGKRNNKDATKSQLVTMLDSESAKPLAPLATLIKQMREDGKTFNSLLEKVKEAKKAELTALVTRDDSEEGGGVDHDENEAIEADWSEPDITTEEESQDNLLSQPAADIADKTDEVLKL